MSVLRWYDVEECDSSGVPLDWERCRGSDELEGGMGSLHEAMRQRGESSCPSCAGHGSLKAAALDRAAYQAATKLISPYVQTIQDWRDKREVIRCEDCGHPRSEGRWDRPGDAWDIPVGSEDWARHHLHLGAEPARVILDRPVAVYFSPCDGGCRHPGPGRGSENLNLRGELVGRVLAKAAAYGVAPAPTFEASWRLVDVRCLSWPHDLRRWKLAVLCTRCWAARRAAS